jgi:hypothetical protein
VSDCVGCPFLRVHDFHYFYCRALGDQAKPDYSETGNGHARRLSGYPSRPKDCPLGEAASPAGERTKSTPEEAT